MKLSAKIAYNTVIQVIGKIVSTVLGLLAVAIMTRYLGNEGFGQYTTIITFAFIFSIIADLGLTLVTSQMINQPQVNQQKVLNNLFGFRLLSAIVIILFAPIAVQFFPYAPMIKLGVLIVSFSFFFLSLNQVFVGLFQKELRTDKMALAEIIGRAAMVIGVFFAMIFDWGLVGMLWAVVLTNLVQFVAHYLFSRQFVKINLEFDWEVWKEIMHRSWPLFLTTAFNLIYLKADILLLSLFKNQVDVGIYGAAYKVVDVLVTLPFMFAGILLPLFVSHWANNNKQQYFLLFQKAFDATAIVVIPLMVGGYFLADPIMALIAGNDFIASGPVLKILILAIGAVFFSALFTHVMVSFERQKKLIKYYALTAITALPLYYFLIQRYSYFGAAWATFYSELLIMACSALAACHYSRFWPKLTILGKSILAAAVMGGGLYLILPWAGQNVLNFVVVLLGASALYFAVVYLLGGLSRADILMLLNKKDVEK
jgi:O-antigen/teichoic acid export membrane protein